MPFPLLPALIAGGLSAGGSIGAGLISSSAQSEANKLNMEEAQRNRQFQQEQAYDQMVFQANMSGSAYQRATADMKAAGLNPMLAFSQGGASTPSGGAGSGSQGRAEAASAGEGVRQAAESAFRVAQMDKELRQADSTIKMQKAQKEAAEASAELSKSSAYKANVEALGKVTDNAAKNIQLPVLKKKAEVDSLQSDWDKKAINYDNINRRIGEGLGTINKAKNVVSPLGGGKGPDTFKLKDGRVINRDGKALNFNRR